MTDIISGDGVPISAPDIIIRNKGLEMIFEECINFWYTNFPDQVEAFKDDMKFHNQIKYKESGMTVGGNFMCKGLIPPSLHKAVGIVLASQNVMDKNASKHWEKHPELINVFFRIFKMGCVNESSDLR